VLQATTTEQALNLFAANRDSIKIAFVSMKMKEIDGPGVVHQFRQLKPDVPIVAFAPVRCMNSIDEISKMGVVRIFVGPVRVEDLYELLPDCS
jgi:DNA-binding NtrC family response regulator